MNELSFRNEPTLKEIKKRITQILKENLYFHWSDIGVTPYNPYDGNSITNRGKLVFSYADKLGLKYARYSEVMDDKKERGNKKFFFFLPDHKNN